MKNLTTLLASTLFALTITGCAGIPYRIDVNQGNEIAQASLEKLTVGMSKEQVQLAIGSTLLNDIFHQNRWDYVHYYKSGHNKKVQKSYISIYFNNDLLSRIETDKANEFKTEPLKY